MPEGPDGKTIIIVKKVDGHGGHHGGAWKVAYADFVTAMMALFLVLWLVNSASVVTREAIASYFKRPGVFELGSGTPLEIGGGGILPDTFAPPADGESTQIIPSHRIYDAQQEGGAEGAGAGSGTGGGGSEGAKKGAAEKAEFETIATEIQSSVEKEGSAVAGLLGQVAIKLDQGGLHLEIMDTPKASMFQLGSAQVQDEARETLLRIAKTLVRLPNPIDIEGHTDGRPFQGSRRKDYGNWELSSDRANAARRLLLEAGMKDWQIARVVGYAAQRLKVKDDPLAHANRRISISMRYTEQAAKALKGTQALETHPRPLKIFQPRRPTPSRVELKPNVAKEVIDSGIDATVGKVDRRARTPEGLAVEVSPFLPDGATYEQSDDSPVRKPSMKKDKIFDDSNPFFSR